MSDIIERLLAKHAGLFQESITTALTNELCRGTLPNYKLYTYLNQDLKFFQKGLNVFGKVLAYCDEPRAAITLGKQIGFISNDENDYFFASFNQIESESLPELQSKIPAILENNTFELPEVKQYNDFLTYLIYKSDSYVELITFLYLMEKVYLEWANHNIHAKVIPQDLPYKYNEWVVLHSGEEFTNWVEFLKQEVLRVVKTPDQEQICENTFLKALKLEISFFNACYDYGK